MNSPYRHPIVQGYRERLLKVLVAGDIYAILRDIGYPKVATASALDGRYYLLANWNDDIHERVMKIVTRNIELETWL